MSSLSDPSVPSAAAILDALRRSSTPASNVHSDREQDCIINLIRDLHHNNLEQWRREDDARNDNGSDATVAAAKRDIDRLNGSRHQLIEAIDKAMSAALPPQAEASLVTESPGMVIDRLSVLVIRLESTEARVAARSNDSALYAGRLPRLKDQLASLEEAVDTLLRDLASGSRRFLAHESLKLYGSRDLGRTG